MACPTAAIVGIITLGAVHIYCGNGALATAAVTVSFATGGVSGAVAALATTTIDFAALCAGGYRKITGPPTNGSCHNFLVSYGCNVLAYSLGAIVSIQLL